LSEGAIGVPAKVRPSVMTVGGPVGVFTIQERLRPRCKPLGIPCASELRRWLATGRNLYVH
jgi:hypothetical protein